MRVGVVVRRAVRIRADTAPVTMLTSRGDGSVGNGRLVSVRAASRSISGTGVPLARTVRWYGTPLVDRWKRMPWAPG